MFALPPVPLMRQEQLGCPVIPVFYMFLCHHFLQTHAHTESVAIHCWRGTVALHSELHDSKISPEDCIFPEKSSCKCLGSQKRTMHKE